MSLFDALTEVEMRYQEVGRLMSQPEVATNPKELRRYATEHSHLEAVVTAYRAFKAASEALSETEELLKDDDPEMREMAELEVQELREQVVTLEADIKVLLLPRDPNDDKNVVLEVRAGTGGDEAALFAGDLFRMYSRFAEANRWKVEILSSNDSDIGGFKEVIALFSGEGVFSKFKYEGGVHRVQRVPTTESQGRIHTSAVTVAIMPEAEAVDVDINEGDLRVDTYRASGAGGQHVNKTESAIRITHKPTGLVVTCQDEKSQHKNRAKAMKVLAARLLDQQQRAQHAELSEARRLQVGSGDRSERIRTYNFPQNRVTDHRIGLTVYKLDTVINGEANYVFEPLIAHFQALALKALEGGGA